MHFVYSNKRYSNPTKLPKDVLQPRRKRLVVASQILNRRRRIKHSCKSRRLTYPFRGFNYLRGNVGASFEFFSMAWQPARCVSISSRVSIKPCDVTVYFRMDVLRSWPKNENNEET